MFKKFGMLLLAACFLFSTQAEAGAADQIGVYDPNSPSRSARRWGVVEVLNEIEAMWAYY